MEASIEVPSEWQRLAIWSSTRLLCVRQVRLREACIRSWPQNLAIERAQNGQLQEINDKVRRPQQDCGKDITQAARKVIANPLRSQTTSAIGLHSGSKLCSVARPRAHYYRGRASEEWDLLRQNHSCSTSCSSHQLSATIRSSQRRTAKPLEQ